MRRFAVLTMTIFMLLSLAACGKAADMPDAVSDGTEPSESDFGTPPDPNEDYGAFYEYLLAVQSAGELRFEDKLSEGGEVTDDFSLTIGGKAFSNKEAEGLTVYTAVFEQFTKVEGHTVEWVGYRFTEVCDLLELRIESSVKLHASDGFSQVFDLKNIDGNTMIAITKDGNASEGPYFAPCTFLISSSYTKYLTDIDIR